MRLAKSPREVEFLHLNGADAAELPLARRKFRPIWSFARQRVGEQRTGLLSKQS